MERTQPPSRDLAIPATALATLRHELRKEAGPLATIHALHSAGYESGGRLYEALATVADPEEPSGLSREAFFRRLSEFFGRRGWGSLSHEAAHPAVGLLKSGDWAEAGEAEMEAQPSCAFSTGMLCHLLTRAADGPVAVLEVSCRARGDDECVFAFGSEAAIHELYGELLDGAGLGEAFEKL